MLSQKGSYVAFSKAKTTSYLIEGKSSTVDQTIDTGARNLQQVCYLVSRQ